MIRIHCYEDRQRDSKFMMIHTFKHGKLEQSSLKMKWCNNTIKAWSRGHREVELVNVARSCDLVIHQYRG